jgi:hypothetical protein
MKNNIVDVNVYIVSKSKEDVISDLVFNMNNLTGIINANVNKNVKRVLDIKYDPKLVSGSGIVNFIRNNNCTGALVGF